MARAHHCRKRKLVALEQQFSVPETRGPRLSLIEAECQRRLRQRP
jgi:hypothetical protein